MAALCHFPATSPSNCKTISKTLLFKNIFAVFLLKPTAYRKKDTV
jgi:hypothetical protein